MIRKYKPQDADAVILIWREASDLAHPFLSRQFQDEGELAIRQTYLPAAETWVISVGNDVVGFVALIGNEIGGLFLHPDHHGKGLGKALVDHAFAQKGTLKVQVFKENVLGRRFYNGYGFQGSEEHYDNASGQVVIKMTYTPG